jgi:integral membrane protein (TIGR01906 family)
MHLNYQNIIKKIALVLFVLAMPVMLFTTSVSTAVNSVWLYEYGLKKYDVTSVTGISNTELFKVAHGLIDYWNNGEATYNPTVIKDGQPFVLFHDYEVHHLADVKALFHFMYKCLLGSFIYVLLFVGLSLFLWKDRKLLAVGLVWGSGLSIFLMIILGLLAITDFQWLFWQFHLLSFTNNLWLLDPSKDYLIMMFPEGFWYDCALIFTAFKIFLALITGFVGWRLLKNND